MSDEVDKTRKPTCDCRVPGVGNGNSRCMAPLRAVCQCPCHTKGACYACREVKPDVSMRDGTGEPEAPMCDECIAEFRRADAESPQW